MQSLNSTINRQKKQIVKWLIQEDKVSLILF